MGGPRSEEGGGPSGVLYVPVRPGSGGTVARWFRTPLGERTAVGFTTVDRLAAALGAGHPAVRLAVPALLALAAPLGIGRITVDPVLVARPVADATAEAAPSGVLLTVGGGTR
ncbi:SAV_915 family protein [Streptomyces sp. JNUCC 64]